MTGLYAILHGDFRRTLRSRVINLLYDLEEIVKVDYLARCKRSDISPLPDPYSLSHILRSAGAYLDGRKNSSLIGISLRDAWVTIRFETAEGNPEETKQHRQHFYDYWVKMYLRRANQGQMQMTGSNLQRNSLWQMDARPDKEPFHSRLEGRVVCYIKLTLPKAH